MFLQLQTQELLQPVSARSCSVTHSIENGLGGVPAALALLGVVTSAPRRTTRTLFGRAGLRLTRIVPSTGLISLVEAVPDSLS